MYVYKFCLCNQQQPNVNEKIASRDEKVLLFDFYNFRRLPYYVPAINNNRKKKEKKMPNQSLHSSPPPPASSRPPMDFYSNGAIDHRWTEKTAISTFSKHLFFEMNIFFGTRH